MYRTFTFFFAFATFAAAGNCATDQMRNDGFFFAPAAFDQFEIETDRCFGSDYVGFPSGFDSDAGSSFEAGFPVEFSLRYDRNERFTTTCDGSISLEEINEFTVGRFFTGDYDRESAPAHPFTGFSDGSFDSGCFDGRTAR